MKFLGIDLGKRGALVLLDGDGALLGWWRTPLAGKEYDGYAMARRLEWVLEKSAGDTVRAFVEGPVVMALHSPQAEAVGEGVGRWKQALDMKGIGYQLVYPSKWVPVFAPREKRKKNPDETPKQAEARRRRQRLENKERLMAEARRRYPKEILWDDLTTETRSGVADALLIAEWGRTISAG